MTASASLIGSTIDHVVAKDSHEAANVQRFLEGTGLLVSLGQYVSYAIEPHGLPPRRMVALRDFFRSHRRITAQFRSLNASLRDVRKPVVERWRDFMAGLSRRAFLHSTAGLAALWAIPQVQMGKALAAPLAPNRAAPTTLVQTILQKTTPTRGQYRTLVAAPGEPHAPRYDLLGKVTNPAARARSRRSIIYLGHMSDNHIIDAQAPARLEPMTVIAPSAFVSALHPQDTLTLHVISHMIQAVNASRYSPVTGAPMAAVVNTGDSADSHSQTEFRWMVDTADGVAVTPNTGQAGVYEGPQAWNVSYAWQPGNTMANMYGQYGFPQVTDLLETAVSEPVESPGFAVPWYVVFGNHDTIFMGTIASNPALANLAIGGKKAETAEAAVGSMADQLASTPSAFQRVLNDLHVQFGLNSGMRDVTPDSRRAFLDPQIFMQSLFNSKSVPGPVGHGFTQNNLDSGQTWWKSDMNPWVRVFGLDTCNHVSGPDGAVPEEQYNWLKSELQQAQAEKKICIVLSHHNSVTLENESQQPFRPQVKLYHAEEFVDMLLGFPNLVAWINGHTHVNMITAHVKSDGSPGGFWEITTASCIDYPQQQQLIELVDNQDGTLSIFATTVDHLGPPTWAENDLSSTGLASLSRELSANHWLIDPLAHTGSVLDRNTELLIPAPFDMSAITDADLERSQNAARARLVAFEAKQKGGQ